MKRFKKLPADIVACMATPPLLTGESEEEYFALVAGLFEDFGASQRIEYLALIRYANCYWEIQRLELSRALIIGHWAPKARIALVRDHSPELYKNEDAVIAERFPNGVNHNLLNGRAIILANANKHLAYIDEQIVHRQRECERLLQHLAFSRTLTPSRNQPEV